MMGRDPLTPLDRQGLRALNHPAGLHLVHRRQPPLSEAELERIHRSYQGRAKRHQSEGRRELVEAVHQHAECLAAYQEGHAAGRVAGLSEQQVHTWRWAFAAGLLLGLLTGAGLVLIAHAAAVPHVQAPAQPAPLHRPLA